MERENIRYYQTEVTDLNNTINALKNPLKGFNNRLNEAEQQYAGRQNNGAHQEQQKEKKKFK